MPLPLCLCQASSRLLIVSYSTANVLQCISCEDSRICQRAFGILEDVKAKIKVSPNGSPSSTDPIPIAFGGRLYSAARHFGLVANSLFTTQAGKSSHWVQEAAGTYWTLPTHVEMMCSAMMVHPDTSVRKQAAAVQEELATSHPSTALNLFCFTMYCIRHEQNPLVKITFLRSLPNLATDPMATGPILQTIVSLVESAGTQSVGIGLLVNLWKRNPRVFPYLHKALMWDSKAFTESKLARSLAVQEVWNFYFYRGELSSRRCVNMTLLEGWSSWLSYQALCNQRRKHPLLHSPFEVFVHFVKKGRWMHELSGVLWLTSGWCVKLLGPDLYSG